jgi:hypothetical protein
MAKKLDGTKRKSNAGRKTKDTPEMRQKIEEAAALDASVEEICFYADISHDTYYSLLKRDPKFSERIKALRQKPILAARQAAIKHSVDSYSSAMDYLKRKRKKEFGDRSIIATEDENGNVQPITGMVIKKENGD